MSATVFFDIGDTLVTAASFISGARDCLRMLRDDGIPIGIISNTGQLTRAELQPHLPAEFSFSHFQDELVLLSGEVGIEKPDPRIFELAIAKANKPPKRCYFVGESLTETFAAQQSGMRTVRLAHHSADFALIPELVRQSNH